MMRVRHLSNEKSLSSNFSTALMYLIFFATQQSLPSAPLSQHLNNNLFRRRQSILFVWSRRLPVTVATGGTVK